MNHFRIFFWLLGAVFFLTHCKKKVDNAAQQTLLYEQTINDVKKNESLSLTFGDDNITTKVNWSVSPNNGVTMNSVANNVTLLFNQAGIYKVTASLGSVYAIYTVTIDDIYFTPNYGSDFRMTASKFVNIGSNEPVVFSVHNSLAGSNIAWSVFSSSYNIVKDDINKTATITFTGGGYGVVTADDGVSSQRRTVWVDNPSVSNSEQDTVPFMMGDKLLLKPSVEQTTSGKKLVITAYTEKKYHCSTDKILSYNFNNDYTIDYSGVLISPQPCNPRSVASCVNSFKNVPIGAHPFTINYGNKTYIGSFNLDAFGTYTFTWPNTSEISVSPLVVN